MKKVLNVLLAMLLVSCFAAQTGVLAAPQMAEVVESVEASEMYEEDATAEESEPEYEESEAEEGESEDTVEEEYAEDEDYESEDEADESEEAEEVEEAEESDEVAVLFTETGDVIYLAKKITLSATSMKMAYGSSKALTVAFTPAETTDQSITWTSSKQSVATVDKNGVVTAGDVAGTAKITAVTANGKKATCSVTVGAPADTVEFSSLKVTSIAVGKTLTLKGKAYRADKAKTVSTAVTFEIISGEEFATIDAKGKVKGIAEGEVVVRATAEVGTEQAYADVTIRVCVPATKVTLNTTKASMILGNGELQLTATMSPENNTDTLSWSSSKETVATVDENGVVTAHSAGSVKITATSGSGKTASCSITVGAPADSVEITSSNTSLAVGKSITLKAKAFRADKTKPISTAVVYEIISGENYATIDANGKVKGVALGKVVVRVRAEVGTEDAYEDVTINVCIPATKVTLNTTKAVMVLGGEDLQLTAVMSPENNTDTLSWSSSKETVATVDENGVVTAHSVGSVKITATSGSGKTASCSVTVGIPADTVEFTSLKSTSLAVGKTLTLKAKASRIDKAKPVSTAVTYEIVSGEEFASIDAKGKVTGIATGEVVVRARAELGTEEAYADVTINVCIPVTAVKFAQSKVTLTLGETTRVQQPVLTPENHTDTLRFYSSDERVVKIDELGNLIPVSKGSAKIYAESGSGKTGYYTVSVVYPEDKLVFELSEESVKVSANKVTLDVWVINNPGIAGITMNLEFDDSVLEVASVSGEDFKDFEIITGEGADSPYKILVANMLGNEVTGDGVLMTVTFNILDDAQKGTYDIALKTDDEDEKLFVIDENGEVIEHFAVDGMVTLR